MGTSFADGQAKKLIEWGWDEPDTKFIRENIEKMEEHPFDGLIFHVVSSQGGNFTWDMWGSRKFEVDEFRHSIDNLKATRFQRFTDRFLRVNVTPGKTDWFDNEAWSIVLNNFGVAATIAKEGACKGFMFDVEQYNDALFDYAKQKHREKKAFAEYQAKVRQRGREWMAEVNRHFPDITVLLTFGYRIAQPPEGKDRSASHYSLLADFLDGMLDGCSNDAKIVDAWEYSYPYKHEKQFQDGYETVKAESLEWTAQPEKYRHHVEAGFGIWMDCRWRQVGWNLDDLTKNHFTPKEFEAAVGSALKLSDQYVWIYTEQPRWWTNERLPEEYVEALKNARMAESRVTVRVLYDNYAHDDALQTDWGFACLVTGTEKAILFDTGGKGDLLLANLQEMKASPGDVDLVVISHTHRDHTGGLLPFLEKNKQVGVYLPADTPEAFVNEVKAHAAEVTVVTRPVEICRGVTILGPLGCNIIEQAMLVDTQDGIVILNGCSHPGIVQVVKEAKTRVRPDIHMILGGMHLLRHTDDELKEVVSELKELGVKKVAPSHCTGDKAIDLFKAVFGDDFIPMGVGQVLRIDNR
jgi:7,8-dihydropterin-6-yl-methyl-4-(beta-D-ribofuranosyl)aminobenzene 5'-phosphate synthase